jgi:hypothetical protein
MREFFVICLGHFYPMRGLPGQLKFGLCVFSFAFPHPSLFTGCLVVFGLLHSLLYIIAHLTAVNALICQSHSLLFSLGIAAFFALLS